MPCSMPFVTISAYFAGSNPAPRTIFLLIYPENAKFQGDFLPRSVCPFVCPPFPGIKKSGDHSPLVDLLSINFRKFVVISQNPLKHLMGQC